MAPDESDTTHAAASPDGPAIDRSTIRAWQVCPEDIVGAETWEEAIAWYCKETGCYRSDLNDETEVPLTKTLWSDEWMDQRITVAQAIAEVNHFPAVICSTEY